MHYTALSVETIGNAQKVRELKALILGGRLASTKLIVRFNLQFSAVIALQLILSIFSRLFMAKNVERGLEEQHKLLPILSRSE